MRRALRLRTLLFPGTRETMSSSRPSPLILEWAGPHGGVPPFDLMQVSGMESALEAAMAMKLVEIDAIAHADQAATFQNTIEALERSGRTLDRVYALYGVLSGNLSTPAFRTVERDMAPRIAAFSDRITQNRPLFDRIDAIYHSAAFHELDPEQQRLVWLYYRTFVRAGARLGADEKVRLAAINQQLASLFTEFNQNVLAEEDDHVLLLESEAELAGLPDSLRAAAAAAAQERRMPGRWVIANTRSSVEPFLVWSERRDLRERAWRMWTGRADAGGAHDNNPLVASILALRAERASLLGFETHAHWRLEDTMAATPERVLRLLEDVWQPAIRRVHQEVADMEAMARQLGDGDLDIEPWDYRHYAEKVRRAHYAIDQDMLREYLQLDNICEAMFWVAGELFDMRFEEVRDVPVFHPDVRVWAVSQRDSGTPLGLWYFDPFARAGKRSGAWMTAYRSQERFDGPVTALVSNNCNYVKGRPGEATLISWDDATTLFHEFGHALHGLCSSVSYPSLSGTAVPRDFVEFPSQLFEHWLATTAVLTRFALHHESGAPIPADTIRRLERAARFNQGFATTEYLASAFIDMKLHLAASRTIDPATFEASTLQQLGMPRQIVMRHRTPHFQHVFGSDSYSAGYYSYLWADTLVADAFEAFQEAGGPFDSDMAARLYRHVLSVGNTVEPAEAYRRFRGRNAGTEALMRKRGFVAGTE
jgi:peptidyl-dipeptidase Dcp